jgi:hypothetical protein
MADFMDKLSEFALKIEKKAPLKLTEEETKIAEEIEAQREGAPRAPACPCVPVCAHAHIWACGRMRM